jgi:hypothetical protein
MSAGNSGYKHKCNSSCLPARWPWRLHALRTTLHAIGGTGLETGTTLYVRLAGDPEPKALRFNRVLLYDCGAGRYARQQQATTFIRRTLKKVGILSS